MFSALWNLLVDGWIALWPSFLAVWSFVHLWGPIALALIFWRLWVRYVRRKALAAVEYVLLEVRLPKEQPRSPKAMEFFFNVLGQKGLTSTFINRYWEGNVYPWFSFELISIEGSIHFVIRTQKFYRPLLEQNLYSQFPDVEIYEIDDYTQRVNYHEDTHSMWGSEFILTKKDPYPIRTYVDYELDKDPREEFKIDPITPMIEWLGSLGKGQQGWVQIMTRKHEDNAWDRKKWKLKEFWEFKTTDTWKDEAKAEIAKIKKEATVVFASDDPTKGQIQLTPGQREKVEALELSTSKPPYDVGIRALYVADQDAFNPVNISALIASFSHYGSGGLNGFKPGKAKYKSGFDYPWQDFRGMRKAAKNRRIFDAYRRRAFFHSPYKRKPIILNTEELATIYHFPGGVSTTPTFKRIESRKAEPPTNLPI